MSEIVVRAAQRQDVKAVAQLHIKAFEDFFLSGLGGSFLAVYYKAVLKSCDGLLFVVENKGKVIGFCAAAKRSKGYNKRLVKDNLFLFGIQGIKLSVTKPKAVVRLLKNFEKHDLTQKDEGDYAELYSIAVDPEVQGSGVGKRLLQLLESELKESGIKELSLTTDCCNNDNVIAFYKSVGYNVMYEFMTYPHRKMYRMIKTLN